MGERSSLPVEMLEMIVENLDYPSMMEFAKTSRLHRQLIVKSMTEKATLTRKALAQARIPLPPSAEKDDRKLMSIIYFLNGYKDASTEGIIYNDYWRKGNNTYVETPLHEEWTKDDLTKYSLRHRLDGPAYRMWNKEGVLVREGWYKDGNMYNPDGPVVREWNDQGTLVKEVRMQNGELVLK